jgi:hypothetical protein
MIVTIVGGARVGKDTAMEVMAREAEKNGLIINVIALADPIKDIIAKTLGITRGQFNALKEEEDFAIDVHHAELEIYAQPTIRKMMQNYGEYAKTQHGTFVWCKLGDEKVKKGVINIISDCRLPLEYSFFKSHKQYPVLSLGVNRPSLDKGDVHHTENLYSKIPVDVTVTNEGTLEEYEEAVARFFTTEVVPFYFNSQGGCNA